MDVNGRPPQENAGVELPWNTMTHSYAIFSKNLT
jgi:hypothetical protein